MSGAFSGRVGVHTSRRWSRVPGPRAQGGARGAARGGPACPRVAASAYSRGAGGLRGRGRDGGVSTVTVCVASPQVGGAPSARALRGSAPAHGSAGLSTHAACVGKAPSGTAIRAEPSLCGHGAGAAPTCAQCPAVAVSDAGTDILPGEPTRAAGRGGGADPAAHCGPLGFAAAARRARRCDGRGGSADRPCRAQGLPGVRRALRTVRA